jgi:prevent-host-death family protein
MAVVVNIHEAKTHLSRLLERVAAGERVVISRAGVPVADLTPHRARPVTIGGLRGQIRHDDAAFEWPDEDIEAMFYDGDPAGAESAEGDQPGSADAAR